MAFINSSDLSQIIQSDLLTALLNGDNAIVTKAADEAEGKLKEYLSGKVDVNTEFAKTGTARNTLLKTYCTDIAIYNIWRYVDPLQIPEPRAEAYREAMEWAKAVRDGETPTTLTAKEAGTDSGGDLLYGSNTARTNQY